jgi:hypothetical protein
MVCGPGTFSDENSTLTLECSSAGTVQGPYNVNREKSVNYMRSRLSCMTVPTYGQASVTYGESAADGGACMKCPPGWVSEMEFGSTSCKKCAEGETPNGNHGKCLAPIGVNVLFWLILAFFFCAACMCFSPCLHPKASFNVAGHKVKVGFLILPFMLIYGVALAAASGGSLQSVEIAFYSVMFFICIPAWCGACNDPPQEVADGKAEVAMQPNVAA